MTNEQIGILKRDFLQWSGGFEPESEHQITVYVDYARASELDRDEVWCALTTWMSAEPVTQVGRTT